MKTIKRSTLSELVRLTRKYYQTSDVDILPARIEVSNRLSEEAFGNEHNWLAFSDLSSAVYGLDANADVNTLASVLISIGYKVQ